MDKRFDGVMTALVTPFLEDGSFDEVAMRNLVDWQIHEGIDGLVVCGSTGEAATLDDEEYRRVVGTVVEATRGRVTVVAGAGSNNTHRAVELSSIAEECGVDGLLHVTPYYNKPTPNGIIAHYSAIASATHLPIIAYNVPGRTGANMPASITLRLAKEVERVIAIKEASGNIEQVAEIIQHRQKGFLVLSGDDALTVPMIALGADGLISVASNEIPAEMTRLVAAARSGDYETARNVHYTWINLMNINFIETNPVPAKTALSMMGKIHEQFRLPLVEMEDSTKEALRVILKEGGLIDE